MIWYAICRHNKGKKIGFENLIWQLRFWWNPSNGHNQTVLDMLSDNIGQSEDKIIFWNLIRWLRLWWNPFNGHDQTVLDMLFDNIGQSEDKIIYLNSNPAVEIMMKSI